MIGRGEVPEHDRQPHGGYYTTEDLLEWDYGEYDGRRTAETEWELLNLMEGR